MNFVRIQNTLPQNPKVALLARMWKCNFDEALGGMVRWLCWLDKHTTDGVTVLTCDELDKLVFGGSHRVAGLIKLGWAIADKDCYISSVDFDKHNGPTAKTRAIATAKKRKQRSK